MLLGSPRCCRGITRLLSSLQLPLSDTRANTILLREMQENREERPNLHHMRRSDDASRYEDDPFQNPRVLVLDYRSGLRRLAAIRTGWTHIPIVSGIPLRSDCRGTSLVRCPCHCDRGYAGISGEEESLEPKLDRFIEMVCNVPSLLLSRVMQDGWGHL